MPEKLIMKFNKNHQLVLLFIAFILIIPLLATLYVKLRTPQIEQETFKTLETISRLHSDQIESWLKERQGDIAVFSNDPTFTDHVIRLQQDSTASTLRTELIIRLQSFRETLNYESIFILGSHGERLLGDGLSLIHI